MNVAGKPLVREPQAKADKRFKAFQVICRDLWFVPAIAVILAILILVIEQARSHVGVKFLAAFIYAMLIGFPAALLLNWIGFRYTERFPRLVFFIHTVALIAMATAGTLAGAFVLIIVGITPHDQYWREVHYSFPIALVITVVVGLSITSFETLRHRLQSATLALRTHQVEQERAHKLLAEAQLSSLESRLHPHFLFNTLNSIASLIPSDPGRAEDTVGKLASLLRFSISANQASLVPLEQELKIVRDYLEIETTRFGARLHYEISVPEAYGSIRVPPLALQTLVENSVKHVVSVRNEPSSIAIAGAVRDNHLELTVSDDGPGFSLREVASDHGLGNLAARLGLLFGESAQFDVGRVGGKTVVTMKIPTGDAK